MSLDVISLSFNNFYNQFYGGNMTYKAYDLRRKNFNELTIRQQINSLNMACLQLQKCIKRHAKKVCDEKKGNYSETVKRKCNQIIKSMEKLKDKECD
jgi:hypothetical protein